MSDDKLVQKLGFKTELKYLELPPAISFDRQCLQVQIDDVKLIGYLISSPDRLFVKHSGIEVGVWQLTGTKKKRETIK